MISVKNLNLAGVRIHFGVAVLAMLYGCSTTNSARIDVLQNRFETPETLGKTAHWIGVRGSIANSTIVEFPMGATAREQLESRRIDVQDVTDTGGNPADVTFAQLAGAYGIADFLELGLEGDTRSVGWFKAKAQFLGQPEATARIGNTSLSLVLRAGSMTVDNERSENCIFCTSYTGDSFASENRMFDLTLLGGYRFSQGALSYLGAFHQKIDHETTSAHEEFDSNSQLVSRKELSWNGSTTSSGAIVGIMFRPDPAKNTRVSFEVSRATTKTESTSLDATYGGMQLTAGW